MRCKTIRLNSAIENSKLVEWTVIRPSAGNSREQFAIGEARCRGMHTVSIYCDRRWFCRPPVMRPPWRRRSKKDPALVPTAASSVRRRLFRVLSIFVPRNGPSFFAPSCIRGFHTGILVGFPSCLRLLVYTGNGMHRPFSKYVQLQR